MKKSFILLIVSFLITLNTLGQEQKQNYFEINGTINADTGKVYLYFFIEYTSNTEKKLVAEIKNNKFSFSGYISEPQGVTIALDDRYHSSRFIIDQGTQTMTVNINNVDEVPDIKNQIMLNEYPNYKVYFKELRAKWDVFYSKNDSLSNAYQRNIPQAISLNMNNEYKSLCKEDEQLLLKYVEKEPDSYISFWRLIDLMGWGYEPVYDSIYVNFSNQLQNGYAGKALKMKLLEGRQLSVGKSFPSISCADINGIPFKLDLFKENTLTLVDFWYSRCSPCRAQFDTLRNLYSQFSNKGFEIVGISTDKEADKDNWKNAILEEKLTWKHYWDVNGKETKNLAINAFPSNFLIDKAGKIIAKNISMSELAEVLKRDLNQ